MPIVPIVILSFLVYAFVLHPVAGIVFLLLFLVGGSRS